MTKTLRLNFTNSDNKTSSITIANPVNASAGEVRTAMNKIIDSGVFKKNGVDLYQKIKSAAYIERTSTTLFDDESAANADKGAIPAGE